MSDLKDIMSGLPSYAQEPIDAPKAAVPVDETKDPVVEEKPKKGAAKAAEKLPDPATHDYTFGKPLGETGKYKLPNGTIVETF